MDNVNVPELVRNLGSEDDSTRKMAAFRLQTAIGDPSFADVFIYQGGLPKLKHLTLSATGNTLAYSLASFTNLLELDIGWDWIGPELVDRLVQLVVGHPLVNILRGAMSILAAVVSHPQPNTKGSMRFGFEALTPSLESHPQFLEMLVSRLSSADHSLCVNALQLINSLMRDAMSNDSENEWPQLINRLKYLGVIAAVYRLMQETALQDLAHPLLEFQTLTKVMLRKWKEISIDFERSDQRRALRSVYLAAHPERRNHPEEITSKRDTHKWRELGFESENPTPDFEAVGYLGLLDLQDFATKTEDGFQRLLLEQGTKEPRDRCPITRVCLAVTSILYDHFEVDEADAEDQQQYVALESHSNFGKLFKPLMLLWSRLHTSGVRAFLRLWTAAGAQAGDFNKIEQLTRVLVEQVVTMAPRSRDISKVEEEITSDWDLKRLRELQMELMEFSHEEAWGRHLRQVKDELRHEATQFMKEQRVRCLLAGSWFLNTLDLGGRSYLHSNPANDRSRQSWRYVRLSHNRRDLHYDDFDSKTQDGQEPSLESLDYKIDLSVVSSVVSNVKAPSDDESSAPNSPNSLQSPVRNGQLQKQERDSHPRTEIVIHGRMPSSGEGLHDHRKGSRHRRNQSSRSATRSEPVGEEKVLLTLHPTSQTLASEWLDGLLMLLNQAPITAETTKLIDFIAKYGLRIRLLNVPFDDNTQGADGYDKRVDIPGREELDDDYHYDIGGG